MKKKLPDNNRPRVGVSSCLLGLKTRYDRTDNYCQAVIDYLKNHQLLPIPVCPEQLGGLPTPRALSELNGDRVITGFEAPSAGVNRVFGITNLSTSDNIKFKNNDSSSSAANRLLLRDNGPDKSLKENETGIFWYDHVSSRWRPYNRIG